MILAPCSYRLVMMARSYYGWVRLKFFKFFNLQVGAAVEDNAVGAEGLVGPSATDCSSVCLELCCSGANRGDGPRKSSHASV